MATQDNTIVYTSIALAVTTSLAYIYYQYHNKKRDNKVDNKKKKSDKKKDEKVITKASKVNISNKIVDNNNNNDDDDLDVDSSMKGYKITSDGKKTSYFTRELSEQEKAIIGDCSPKLLSSTSEPISNEPRLLSSKEITINSDNNGSSIWNKAGTFEERYYSDYAEKRLKALLQEVNYKSPEGAVVSILNVKNVTGDALVTFSRQKKKYIYDYLVEADFKLFEPSNGNVLIGTITVKDITADCDYEYITKVDNNTNNNYYKKYVQSSTGLQPAISKALDKFLDDFKEYTSK